MVYTYACQQVSAYCYSYACIKRNASSYCLSYGIPPEIRKQLVSFDNPKETITNSDLELAGTYLHHDTIAQNCDLLEHTLASHVYTTSTVFWQRKGAATSIPALVRLLRLQALHQRCHRYVPRHDFIADDNSKLADDPSRLSHFSDQQFLRCFNLKYPQHLP